MGKPVLFIGSARESLEMVDALEESLIDDVSVQRWDSGASKAGDYTLESLMDHAARSDFAVFALGQDDRTESRGKSQPSPRDNVIFEAGLFARAIGLKRTFFIVDSRGTKRPSDWDGLGYLTYHADRPQPQQKVLEAVKQIRQRVKERGERAADRPTALIHGDWWQIVVNTDRGAVLSHLAIDVHETDGIRIKGDSWSSEGGSHGTYRSRAATYDLGDQTLYYSWEGEHTREAALPKYFGIGEIHFDLRRKETPVGKGFFSTTNGATTETLVKQCNYFPASERDLATLRRGETKQIENLTKKLLLKREEMTKLGRKPNDGGAKNPLP